METLKKWVRAVELSCGYSLFEERDWQKILMGLALLGGLGYLLIKAFQFSWPAFGIAAIVAMIIIAWFKELGSEAWRTWAMRLSTTIVASLAVCAGIGAGQMIDLTPYVDVSAITNPPKASVAKAEDAKEKEKASLKKGSPEWLEEQFGTIKERLDEYGRQINCLQEKEGGGGKAKTPAKAKSDADSDTLFDFDDPPNLAKPAPKEGGAFKRGSRGTPAPATAPAPPPLDGGLRLDLPPLPGDEEPRLKEEPIQKIDRSLKGEPKKGVPKSAPKSDSPGNRLSIPRIADSEKADAPQSASIPAKRILLGYRCTMDKDHLKGVLYQDPNTGNLLPYKEDLHYHPDGTPCRCKEWLWKPTK